MIDRFSYLGHQPLVLQVEFLFNVPQPFWFSYCERWMAFVFTRALDEEFLFPVSSVSDITGDEL